MLGKGLLQGLGVTLRHLLEKDITVQYPEEMPSLQTRFRGHLYQEFGKCIVCGICVKSCPNNVLSMEEGRNEQSKKKLLLRFTIDHQYCMFCNICVENCPANCLHFNHDFELARFSREETKTVYERAKEMAQMAMEIPSAVKDDEGESRLSEEQAPSQTDSATEQKEIKKDPAEAMLKALLKNPAKLLAKYLPGDEQAAAVAVVLQKDEKKARKLAELMVSDREKARRVIEAMLKTARKSEEVEGGAEGGNKSES